MIRTTCLAVTLLATLASMPVLDANAQEPGLKSGAVYAKIILPMKEPAKGEHPVVESWIVKKLQKREVTEFRAVTNWVRLAETGEQSADVWSARLDGQTWGCPVSGRVSERTTDGKVKAELSGWSPVAVDEIKGGTISAETGSRTIATVDTGSIDQDGRAFIALVVGPVKATHDLEQENQVAEKTTKFRKLYSVPTDDKDAFKNARVAVSINQKSVLSRNYIVSGGEKNVRDRIGAYLWRLDPDDPKRSKLPDSTTFGFVPNSTLAYQVHWGKGVRFWDSRTHTASGDYIPHELREDTTMGPAVSPSGQIMVTRSQLNHLQFWDIDSRKPITKEIEQAGIVFSMAFSSDEKWFFSRASKTLAIRKAKTGELVTGGLKHDVGGFPYSEKRQQVVTVENSTSDEGELSSELVIRSGESFTEVARVELEAHAREVNWVGENHLLVVGDNNKPRRGRPSSHGRNVVFLVSLDSDQPQVSPLARHFWISNVTISPNAGHFIVRTRDETSCWKVGESTPSWKKSGNRLASFGDEGWVVLHDGPAIAYSLNTGKELWRKEDVGMMRVIGSHIWTCNENGQEVWKVERDTKLD